ncbi:ABC transporter ATP-binding protein [Avibacterium avium]|uniref:ABC transporter ATP-binding protein n=1 Tax=Avibacterium avium TaxID=751 RepID=UPI003BF7E46C
MNNDIAIRVNHLTKVYKLYNKPSDRLREALNPFKKSYHKDFYALNDVSFEIKKGETVGIIGKNGAGKSTILKIITGVLTPSSGDVQVNGRIASLLELGAGFNLEYTGLENIYLQGTLMGFSHEEIEARVQNILDFADIGDFVYQPVKSYSSGMFARLAFSVAINVAPDILIVDEALSVGDMAFQNKCIRKMEEMGQKGITILFVSHDSQAINKFCSEVIWINQGAIKERGEPSLVFENYMSLMSYGLETERQDNQIEKESSSGSKQGSVSLIDVSSCESFGEKKALITGVAFIDESGAFITRLKQRDKITFICEFATTIDLYDVGIGVLFKDHLNNDVLTFNSYLYKKPLSFVSKGSKVRVMVSFVVPKLSPKEYNVTVALSEGTQLNHVQQHWIHTAMTVNIVSCDFVDSGCMISLYPDEVEYCYEQV